MGKAPVTRINYKPLFSYHLCCIRTTEHNHICYTLVEVSLVSNLFLYIREVTTYNIYGRTL